MAAISNSLILTKSPGIQSSSGSHLNSLDQYPGRVGPSNLFLNHSRAKKVRLCAAREPLRVEAGYRDGGNSSSHGAFIGGFILGGLIVGTLGCVYAPQISRALAGTDKRELMRKLPKFVYNEEKALEKTRDVLTQKIEQLNSALDAISSNLRSEDSSDDPPAVEDQVKSAA